MTVSILNYTDYRVCLRDWFWSAKSANPKISFRYVARLLGLSAPNHFHLVISGKRNLSPKTLDKALKLMKLDELERQYLKLVFKENISTSISEKELLQTQIVLLQKRLSTDSSPQKLEDHLQIIGNTLAWYIKMGAPAFEGLSKEDIFKSVERSCCFPINKSEFDRAISILENVRQITFENGLAKFENSSITTKWTLDKSEGKNHHRTNLNFAMKSLEWPIDQRFHSSVSIPCSEELYQEITEEIQKLCLSILDKSNSLIHNASEVSKVATLQLSLFPYFQFKNK